MHDEVLTFCLRRGKSAQRFWRHLEAVVNPFTFSSLLSHGYFLPSVKKIFDL